MGYRLILMQLLLVSSLLAQGTYPLSVGNSWEYYRTPIPDPSTYDHTAMIIGDTLLSNGHTYAIERSTPEAVRLLRQDGDRVLQYVPSGDSVLYDFSLHTGDTLRVQYIEPYPGEFDTLITRVTVVGTDWFGRQWHSWRFETVSATRGVSRTELVVDSLGLVSFFDDFAGERAYYCSGARINGEQYGTISDASPDFPSYPAQVRLYRNYPNPFNPTTVIGYSLLVTGHVTVKIYDVLGTEVAALVDGIVPAGEHTVRWDASALPAGVYLCRLVVGGHSETRKTILMK